VSLGGPCLVLRTLFFSVAGFAVFSQYKRDSTLPVFNACRRQKHYGPRGFQSCWNAFHTLKKFCFLIKKQKVNQI
jgi:hypothetical protein